MAKLLCSCLCLFDVIVDLHVMDRKKKPWKVKVDHVIKANLIHNFYLLYVVEAFISLN